MDQFSSTVSYVATNDLIESVGVKIKELPEE